MGRIAEAALARHRAITMAALALLVIIAWAWIALGAGMGMPIHAALALFPHNPTTMPAIGSMAGSTPGFALTFSMWWVMMIAMMLPSAAPTVLLYARASHRRTGDPEPPTAIFVLGYLIVWGGFSALAALGQSWLQAHALMGAMTMQSASRWLSAIVLLAAGAFQLSPLKDACLASCRNPAAFISRHYRPGAAGAIRLGLIHGGYCLGCCWLLMGILFVGGTMNLAWIALLTLFVAAEKMLPHGRRIAIASGIGLIGWGVATLLV
ncbi:DUF2182 domain-containing protein [Sphingorhabdus soli]|uniref:DUF2182 domain-containing protein n=1 Tax=Flavisphingopyxis soli TaxID=2601267 RepID=A0A5C6UN76_9SPHN|nr:DUF2182 domain-containing protein [Sphingorhabdus soli]TXC74004.1 DUF2182 domain-containing protein [Sphingorhabdus soli]